MTSFETKTEDVLCFGPFALVLNQRLLTREGSEVRLGARALDILITLASRPNEVINKKELLETVWSDVTVEESSLRFHVVGLRQALGDGKDGGRYIATVSGRGYCFVAPVLRKNDLRDPAVESSAALPITNLPNRLSRIVGRAGEVSILSKHVQAVRFVTIVGPGGIGKTTVAVEVGHELVEAFSGAVVFVDLGALSDPNLVATAIASMLGLSVQSEDATPGLLAFLRDKRVLLIFDNCEHLVKVAAALTQSIYASSPHIYILATSREPLRVEGEHVCKLEPLAFPVEDVELTGASAQSFPAVQLFLERAAAAGARLNLHDPTYAIVAGICRKLDGLALPIELAAGRVGVYGLQQTAELLDERLSLRWAGQRTAPPRQQTLKATLDWSYGLLTEVEQRVLKHLTVFAGHFSLEAARAVLASTSLDEESVLGALDSLANKSMVATNEGGTSIRFRLLDTTRAYAREDNLSEAELSDLCARHAIYYRKWLEQTAIEWPTLTSPAERALRQADLANVRAALEWCFSVDGQKEIGIKLASAAVQVFWVMSLLSESHSWAERALSAMDDAMRESGEEMHLQAALGMSFMFARGEHGPALSALTRSLEIAERRCDAKHQLQLLVPMSAFYTRLPDFAIALKYAKSGIAIAESFGDRGALAVARTLLGIALHFMGDLHAARTELEAALKHGAGDPQTTTLYLGSGQQIWAGIALSRTLWFQGRPARALELARQTIQEAASLDQSLMLALNWCIPVFLWTGRFQEAETHIDWHQARAKTHSTSPEVAIGRGMRGQLQICRGEVREGVSNLQLSLEALGSGQYELRTELNMSLAQGLAALDRFTDSILIIDECIKSVDEKGDFSFMPELLRLKGALLMSSAGGCHPDAESYFQRSLELGRRQGALEWELRSSVDLAKMWAAQGRTEDARALLRPVFNQFVDGSETADVQSAEHFLATLG